MNYGEGTKNGIRCKKDGKDFWKPRKREKAKEKVPRTKEKEEIILSMRLGQEIQMPIDRREFQLLRVDSEETIRMMETDGANRKYKRHLRNVGLL